MIVNTLYIVLIFSNLVLRVGKPEVIVPELIKSLSDVQNLVYHEEVYIHVYFKYNTILRF